MRRSCGDDCVDKLAEHLDALHSTLSILDSSTGKGFCFKSRSTSESVVIDLITPEGRQCNAAIDNALLGYKQAKLENLGALALGKMKES